MAENKKAPAEGRNGVDGWTTNGYGLLINGEKVEPTVEEEQDIEEIEEA